MKPRHSMRIPYNKEKEPANRLMRTFSMSSNPDEAAGDALEALKGKVPLGIVGNYVKISEIYNEMSGLLTKFNSKIGDKIAKEESEIISTYNKKMEVLQKELAMIKDAYSQQEKERAENDKTKNTRILEIMLKKQREDTQKLDEICERQRKEIQHLTQLNDQLQKDYMGCEKRLKKCAKENKRLQVEIYRLEQKVEEYKEGQVKVFEDKSKTVIRNDNIEDKGKSNESLFAYLKQQKMDKTQLLSRCEEYSRKLINRYEDIIFKLKQQIANEKKLVQRLKYRQTYAVSSRSELENLFLECVEEMRCKISREDNFVETDLQQLKRPIMTAYEKVLIMENFMMNDKLLQVLYDVVFTKDGKKENNELPLLAPKSNSFIITETKQKEKHSVCKNKSFINEPEETSEPKRINISRCKTNSPTEMKLRKRIYNIPVHRTMRKGKLMISKREEFRDKLLGKKLIVS